MVTRQFDLTGLDCPEPAIIAYREFGKLGVGDWLEAKMDVEECAYMAAELINRSGFGLAAVEKADNKIYTLKALRLR